MADLQDKDSSISSKLVGADSSGVESNFAKVSANQDLGVSDIADVSALYGNITVAGGSRAELKIGSTSLSNRKMIIFQAQGNNLWLGYSNSVDSTNGIRLTASDMVLLPIGPNTSVWVFNSGGSSQSIRVQELS